MAKSFSSPTGRLLRSSRLFSLPPPLPAPPTEKSSSNHVRFSDTATLPYPTHQAITTPRSSHSRGDWGLKRALPQRTTTTRSSTPLIRVKDIDNHFHVTDFESAADHTLSLSKWQEMNVVMSPYTLRETVTRNEGRLPASVFVSAQDNTALQGEATLARTPAERAHLVRRQSKSASRWKTRGPALAKLTEDEFQTYLDANPRQRTDREEFMHFLRDVRVSQKRSEAIEKKRDETGYDAGNESDVAAINAAAHLSSDEFSEWVLQLRDDSGRPGSEIQQLIADYYDLPYRGQANAHIAHSQRNTTVPPRIPSEIYPSTHPSAGLSYLRTDAYLDNHPNYGPQTHHPVVQARVLRPRIMAQGKIDRAILGVGGFVTSDNQTHVNQGKQEPGTPNYMIDKFDMDIKGGNKIWVHPLKAYVTDDGRVRLQVDRGHESAIEVKTGQFDPKKPRAQPVPSAAGLIAQSQSGARKDRGFAQDELRTIRKSVENKGDALAEFKKLYQHLEKPEAKSPPKP